MSNIFSIPPGTPFLPTLIDSLYDGTLVGKIGGKDSPFEMCDITIYLPTRRAMRELTRLLRMRQNDTTILLPKIRALGAIDEDEIYFHNILNKDISLETFAKPVSPLARNLRLAILIEAWAKRMKNNWSPSQTFGYAQELSNLLDQAVNESINWHDLEKIDCGNHAKWWQLTKEFLAIATKFWQQTLTENNEIDEAQLRVDGLLAQAKIYESGKHNAPVIAAGSTGSVATTMQLLKAISKMERGAIILPGLDNDLPQDLWQKLETSEKQTNQDNQTENEKLFSHPQYGLRHLLLGLGIERKQVRTLPQQQQQTQQKNQRNSFISQALVPSEATSMWHKGFDTIDMKKACENISLITAQDEHKEALAIALAMRESLQTLPKNNAAQPAIHCALITPERNLARRVSIELQRFGIVVDDSAGQSLLHKPHGIFATLVAKLAFDEFDAINLFSLLQHPLCNFGVEKNHFKRAIKLLEAALLRGQTRTLTFGKLENELHQVQASLETDIYAKIKLQKFTKAEWHSAENLCKKLDSIFTQIDETNLIISFIKIIEAIAIDKNNDLTNLYGGEIGSPFYSLLLELYNQQELPKIAAHEFSNFLEALLYPCTIRPAFGTHPHLAILGPLEARLQNFELVILAGLNERIWPSLSSGDLFLSRKMKSQLGLPVPERRIGLAAHDFQMLLGFENVIISRAKNLSGSPSLASRWWQRLTTLAGEVETKNMERRGEKYLHWANLIDSPNEIVPTFLRPNPKPPLAMRPRKLSISDIGRWIENPYEIYAKHILKLRPIENFNMQLGPMQRGSLFHDIFDEFISQQASSDKLLEIAENYFAKYAVPLDVKLLWHSRLVRIIEIFISWHENYKKQIKKSFAEIAVDYKFADLNFTIKGRADRIDILTSGEAIIFDYKTGDMPHINSVRELQAPQLLLTGLLAKHGAFSEIGKIDVANVAYIRLREAQELPVDYLVSEKNEMQLMLDGVYAKLKNLIETFDKQSQAYGVKRLAKPRGKFAGFGDDYAHLARTLEWSLSDGDDGDEL